jgi:integrase/recombinase XerC
MSEKNKPTRSRYYKTGRKSLTRDQMNKFLSVITDISHLAMFELALTTGIRRSDIVEIRINDFDFERRKLSFYEHKKRRLKTVFLSDRVATKLKMVAKTRTKGTYFFQNSRGNSISSRTAYNIFQRYLKKAGLDQRPFHSLRATCIKLCQASGWKPEETAELVGDSLKVIQEHYTIPSDDDMKEVIEKKAIL